MTQSTLPSLDFTTFVLSVASAAFYSMGIRALDDAPGSAPDLKVDLELARHNIELLNLLHEKTRGNRTPDEDRLLDQLLFETRMKFVELTKN